MIPTSNAFENRFTQVFNHLYMTTSRRWAYISAMEPASCIKHDNNARTSHRCSHYSMLFTCTFIAAIYVYVYCCYWCIRMCQSVCISVHMSCVCACIVSAYLFHRLIFLYHYIMWINTLNKYPYSYLTMMHIKILLFSMAVQSHEYIYNL